MLITPELQEKLVTVLAIVMIIIIFVWLFKRLSQQRREKKEENECDEGEFVDVEGLQAVSEQPYVVTLSWDPLYDADGYYVRRYEQDPLEGMEHVEEVRTYNTTLTFGNLSHPTQFFTVFAYRNEDKCHVRSPGKTVSTLVNCVPVLSQELLKPTWDDDVLRWNSVPGVSSYSVNGDRYVARSRDNQATVYGEHVDFVATNACGDSDIFSISK